MFKMFKKDGSSEENELNVTISNKTVIRVLALVFAAIIFLALVRQASHALLLIFIAFFLTLALNSPVQGIARHLPGSLRGKRSVATSVSFLLIVLLFAGF